MELNVTKMTFNGFRLGSVAKRLLGKEKTAEMQGKQTTPASMNLFKKFIQNQKNRKKELNHG
jgi:hypothetical protein